MDDLGGRPAARPAEVADPAKVDSYLRMMGEVGAKAIELRRRAREAEGGRDRGGTAPEQPAAGMTEGRIMEFDRDELLKECELAAKAVKYARRWWESRDGESLTLLRDKLDALNQGLFARCHLRQSGALRAEFLEDNPSLADPPAEEGCPAKKGPLSNFDDAVGSFFPSWWKAANPHPSFPGEPDRKALEEVADGLAKAAAELRVALEGKPAATIVTGSQAKLLRTLGYKKHYPGKLRALAAKGVIRLESLPLGEGEKRMGWRMEVLDADRARNRNG